MADREQFEVAKMPRQHRDAAPGRQPNRFVPMLASVVSDVAIDIAGVELEEMHPLRRHPTEVAIGLAEDREPGCLVNFRERDSKVAHRDGSIAAIERHRDRSGRRTYAHRTFQRERA
jgi:hypothetical protein